MSLVLGICLRSISHTTLFKAPFSTVCRWRRIITPLKPPIGLVNKEQIENKDAGLAVGKITPLCRSPGVL